MLHFPEVLCSLPALHHQLTFHQLCLNHLKIRWTFNYFITWIKIKCDKNKGIRNAKHMCQHFNSVETKLLTKVNSDMHKKFEKYSQLEQIFCVKIH